MPGKFKAKDVYDKRKKALEKARAAKAAKHKKPTEGTTVTAEPDGTVTVQTPPPKPKQTKSTNSSNPAKPRRQKKVLTPEEKERRRLLRNELARDRRWIDRDELTGKSLKELFKIYAKKKHVKESLEETIENYGGDKALLRRDMMHELRGERISSRYLYGTGAAIKKMHRQDAIIEKGTGKGVHTATLLQIWKNKTGKSKSLEALINEKGSKYKARNYLLVELGLSVPKRTYTPTGNPRGRPKKDPNAPRKTIKKSEGGKKKSEGGKKKSGSGKKKSEGGKRKLSFTTGLSQKDVPGTIKFVNKKSSEKSPITFVRGPARKVTFTMPKS